MNDWLLGIGGWLLEVKGRGFLLRPHCVRLPARPPLLQGQLNLPENKNNELDGVLWLKPVFVSRHSLNKFRANPSPLPKYSLQIIHSPVLLFQIVNL